VDVDGYVVLSGAGVAELRVVGAGMGAAGEVRVPAGGGGQRRCAGVWGRALAWRADGGAVQEGSGGCAGGQLAVGGGGGEA